MLVKGVSGDGKMDQCEYLEAGWEHKNVFPCFHLCLVMLVCTGVTTNISHKHSVKAQFLLMEKQWNGDSVHWCGCKSTFIVLFLAAVLRLLERFRMK